VPANKLYAGDNLNVLRKRVPGESVDLVYLDPPFNSRSNYYASPRSAGKANQTGPVRAFDDVWKWGKRVEREFARLFADGDRLAQAMAACRTLLDRGAMLAYLTMMAPRLCELHRVLRPTGSLYLHCDPSASHYLRVLLDAVFGPGQFRNEIVWRRTGCHGPRRSFGPVHDNLLFYSKTADYFFRVTRRPYMRGHVTRRYRKESSGRFKFTSGGNVLTGARGTNGDSGKPWRGFDPTAKNRHWAVPGFLAEQMPAAFEQLGVLDKLDALYQAGFIEIRPGAAWPVPVRHLKIDDGQPLPDIWSYQPYTEGTVHESSEGIDADVAWLGPTDPERHGYPTQKPLGLLERIIRSSCPEGGTVLDPFCGSGTTLIAAHQLQRRWVGIDAAKAAIALTKRRLLDACGLKARRDYGWHANG
jgi:DNA modification methylase